MVSILSLEFVVLLSMTMARLVQENHPFLRDGIKRFSLTAPALGQVLM